MKVLFISAWYPNRQDPLLGLFVQKHAQAVALFANVAVLYVVADSTCNEMEAIQTTENNILTIRIYYPKRNNDLINRLFTFKAYLFAYFKGFRLLHKTWGKPDIIQANVFTRTACIANIYKLIFKTPYTVIEHWTRYFRTNTFENNLHKYLTGVVATNASALMPVTRNLQTGMIKHGIYNKNYHVINNVVSSDFFQNQIYQQSQVKTIINVSSFDDKQKNISGIIKVARELSTYRQDFRIILIGDGNDFIKIKNLATELQLLNNVVFFAGMLKGDELIKAYQSCNFSLLFSNYENIPVVISESLCCGKPVVSTNVGGISEHINETNGILIPAGDEKALTESLNYMLDHFQEYDSALIQLQSRNKYSMQSVGANLYSIYQQILAN